MLALSIGCLASAPAKLSWDDYATKTDDWYRSPEGRRVADNILSWQSREGSWPKNTNTTANPFTGDPGTLKGTFDNGATPGELRFLARALGVTKDPRCQQAFLKGLDHILKAQYPTGGWPQYYPPGTQYHRHITFNDHAMVRLMEFLREVYEGRLSTTARSRAASAPNYGFVDTERREAAQASFDRGIRCILKCQVVVNGWPTAWCAQHDEVDYRPRAGRTYELASLSGAESAGLLQLLMSLDSPGAEVIRAIQAGAAWFESARLTGIRETRINGDKIIVKDAQAPPLWARFYEIETNRPIFADRDGVKKYSLAEIGAERRNGYAWYGTWGGQVARDYSRWKEKWLR